MTTRQQVTSAGSARTLEGGTIWTIGAAVVAVLGSVRMWTLVPRALDRFVFSGCDTASPPFQLTTVQVGVAIAAGFLSIALAEFGVRREGNRWIAMIASVVGVSLVFGGGLLALSLWAGPLSCSI